MLSILVDQPQKMNPVLLISVAYDIGQLLSAGSQSDELIKAAKGLLSDERTDKRRKILCDLLLNLEDRSELESRDDDEGWFKGIKCTRVLPQNDLKNPLGNHLDKIYMPFQKTYITAWG